MLTNSSTSSIIENCEMNLGNAHLSTAPTPIPIHRLAIARKPKGFAFVTTNQYAALPMTPKASSTSAANNDQFAVLSSTDLSRLP